MLKVRFPDKFSAPAYVVDGAQSVWEVRHFGFTDLMCLKLAKWLKEWMEGYAISAYAVRHAERRARRAMIGIWGDKISFHPGEWRKNSTNARIL